MMTYKVEFYARVGVKEIRRVLREGEKKSKQYYITIPKALAEAMRLERKQFVKVIIRRVK